MMKWSKKIGTAGLFVAALALVLTTGQGGGIGANTAQAAAAAKASSKSKALAAVYLQIQTQNASKVVELVNKERKNAGMKPLMVHTNLTKMAKTKAIDMFKTGYFSHTSPKYGSPFDMMDSSNITYLYAGENIGKGQRSAEEVVKDWMDSPGHKANILNPKYKLIGVGYYNGYWVQEFIGK
ncbi:MAG: CAP domain-containing protein [Paenibacillus sp.]|uniref:CAP domain-containing protein n=1 Tax=Paenibacillus sp. TaxID=58172 RepID=UPI0029068CD5|nr:CAP domain-containing protein [Paenibacillus sp.]MDU4696028.1 CAP domain-containing protein [Paenibacillus sp.]